MRPRCWLLPRRGFWITFPRYRRLTFLTRLARLAGTIKLRRKHEELLLFATLRISTGLALRPGSPRRTLPLPGSSLSVGGTHRIVAFKDAVETAVILSIVPRLGEDAEEIASANAKITGLCLGEEYRATRITVQVRKPVITTVAIQIRAIAKTEITSQVTKRTLTNLCFRRSGIGKSLDIGIWRAFIPDRGLPGPGRTGTGLDATQTPIAEYGTDLTTYATLTSG